MNLAQYDAEILSLQARISSLGMRLENHETDLGRMRGDIMLADTAFTEACVAELVNTGQELEPSDAGESLAALQSQEEALFNSTQHLKTALETLRSQLQAQQAARENYRTIHVKPFYVDQIEQRRTELLEAACKLAICTAIEHDVPLAMTSTQRVVERAIGQAISNRTLDTARAELAVEMAAQAAQGV